MPTISKAYFVVLDAIEVSLGGAIIGPASTVSTSSCAWLRPRCARPVRRAPTSSQVRVANSVEGSPTLRITTDRKIRQRQGWPLSQLCKIEGNGRAAARLVP